MESTPSNGKTIQEMVAVEKGEGQRDKEATSYNVLFDAHAKELMEYKNGLVAIHPKFNKLITSLRIAVEKGEGSLDKEIMTASIVSD